MEVLHPRCAGIDISKKDAKVAVRLAGGGRAGTKVSTTTWSSMSREIVKLREFLIDQQVTCVVMEATSDYWKPFYYALEDAPFEVLLATPTTRRTCRAVRPMSLMPPGWRTWVLTGCCAVR